MGLFYFSEPEASMLVCAMSESDTLSSAQTLAKGTCPTVIGRAKKKKH